jgi:hypothetical protein
VLLLLIIGGVVGYCVYKKKKEPDEQGLPKSKLNELQKAERKGGPKEPESVSHVTKNSEVTDLFSKENSASAVKITMNEPYPDASADPQAKPGQVPTTSKPPV